MSPALLRNAFSKHSIAVFNGRDSRHHRDVSIYTLWNLARKQRSSGTLNFDHFVQFVGFPRSGHSLVGALLNAHPGAIVSHELDAMGLFMAGMSVKQVISLIRWHTAEFERNGCYWNNFSYATPPFDVQGVQPSVYGDKKGDWTVRHLGNRLGFLQTLQRRLQQRDKWLLVLRNPFDNISTLSLRVGKAYDQLRIKSESEEEFKRRLQSRQAAGVPSRVNDEMIADYAGLCESIQMIKSRVDSERWLEIDYEAMLVDPKPQLSRMCEFLKLNPYREYIDSAASIVSPKPNRTRFNIEWTEEQKEQVYRLIDKFSFLQRFEAAFEA